MIAAFIGVLFATWVLYALGINSLDFAAGATAGAISLVLSLAITRRA